MDQTVKERFTSKVSTSWVRKNLRSKAWRGIMTRLKKVKL